MSNTIGDAAGALWELLDKQGACTATKLAKESKLDTKTVQRALGWLAKEDKLSFETQGRSELISLK